MSDITVGLKQYKWELLTGALVTLVAVLATVLYVGSEQFFYISDFNFYHIAAIQSLDSLKSSPFTFLLLLVVSTRLTHNLLFTLPLALWMLFLGTSRVAFVLALVLSFTLPYLFVLAQIMRQSLAASAAASSRQIWLITIVVAAVIPVFWIPAWRGYPDNLAALPASIVTLLYLRANRVLSYKHCLLFGVLLALAPLFRRHYFFADIAIIGSLFVDQLLFAAPGADAVLLKTRLLTIAQKFALMALSFAGFLCTFGCMFVLQIVSNDYLNLYKSAATPSLECFGYFVSAYGVPFVVTAGSGIVLAWFSERLEHSKVRFLILYTLALALIWPLFGTHIAHHYLLYWMPFVVFGNAFFVYLLCQKNLVAGSLLALYCGINLFVGLAPMHVLSKLPLKPARFGMLRSPVKQGEVLSVLFSAAFGPLQRHDLPEVERLIRRLRTLSSSNDKILAGCSWDTAEADALRNAERKYFGATSLQLLNQPYADSSESFALERMLNAKFILVTTPVFYLYNKPGECLADMFVDTFTKKWEFTRDFEQLPDLYKFDDGYSLTIYERINPTLPPVAVRSLQSMIACLPQYPGGQPVWINTDNCSETVGETRRDHFVINVCGAETDASHCQHYLLSSRTYQGAVTVSGAASDAQGLKVQVVAYSPTGVELDLQSAVLGASGEFDIKCNAPQSSHLVLFVSQPAGGKLTSVELSKLKILATAVSVGSR